MRIRKMPCMEPGCDNPAVYVVSNDHHPLDKPIDEERVEAFADEVGCSRQDARDFYLRTAEPDFPISVCYVHVPTAVDHFLHQGCFPIQIDSPESLITEEG